MKGRGVAHCADKTLPGVSLITALIRRSRALLWGRGGLTFSATICAQTSACLGGIAVISSACADLRPAKGCVGETPLRKRWSQVRSETIYMRFNHVQLRRASAPLVSSHQKNTFTCLLHAGRKTESNSELLRFSASRL